MSKNEFSKASDTILPALLQSLDTGNLNKAALDAFTKLEDGDKKITIATALQDDILNNLEQITMLNDALGLDLAETLADLQKRENIADSAHTCVMVSRAVADTLQENTAPQLTAFLGAVAQLSDKEYASGFDVLRCAAKVNAPAATARKNPLRPGNGNP